MNDERRPAVRFLHAVANLVSAAGLYGPSHPARRRAAATAHEELATLLETDSAPAFSFVEEEVVYGDEPLRELRGWPWSRRLSDAGVQRVEFRRGATAGELERFVDHLAARLEGRADEEDGRSPNIRYGTLGLSTPGTSDPSGAASEDATDSSFGLTEESEAIRWINEEAAERGRVPTTEAAAVVRGLSVAMHDARQLVAPLLAIKSTDQYTTAHCINVSILAMSLAEYLTYGDAEVRAIGEAALLHDIGKTRIPLEVLNKPGLLTDDERAVVQRHPVEGARLLLQAEPRHALAAMVAYEHHMHWDDGGGYPPRRYPRRPHRFSRLVQVCDVYDALRTRRPFRGALSSKAALRFLRERSGIEFDPELVTAFTEMMSRWEPRIVEASEPEADEEVVLPPGEVSFDADTERRPLVG